MAAEARLTAHVPEPGPKQKLRYEMVASGLGLVRHVAPIPRRSAQHRHPLRRDQRLDVGGPLVEQIALPVERVAVAVAGRHARLGVVEDQPPVELVVPPLLQPSRYGVPPRVVLEVGGGPFSSDSRVKASGRVLLATLLMRRRRRADFALTH